MPQLQQANEAAETQSKRTASSMGTVRCVRSDTRWSRGRSTCQPTWRRTSLGGQRHVNRTGSADQTLQWFVTVGSAHRPAHTNGNRAVQTSKNGTITSNTTPPYVRNMAKCYTTIQVAGQVQFARDGGLNRTHTPTHPPTHPPTHTYRGIKDTKLIKEPPHNESIPIACD
jgi:hypothetical protein